MRKEMTITIDEGRDAGKVFRITEMPVSRLEKWAARALVALFGAADDIPPDVAHLAETSSGAALAAVFLRGLRSFSWERAEPLYDELLDCIDRVPNPAQPSAVIRLRPDNLDAHVEDISTIWRLRAEAVGLSLGFFENGGDWNSLLTGLLARRGSEATPTSPAA